MIPFISFDYTNKLLREKFLYKTAEVIDSKNYVLGNEVNQFEEDFAKSLSINYAIGVGNGLDALIISLKALDIKVGDEVIVPSNTYIASWLAVSQVGATIVPVEPDIQTYNIDPKKIEEKINPKTKAIMPVHLYGQASDMKSIMDIANKYNLYVIEDNAQAQLASWSGRYTGTFGHINATSFYPTKNLGAFGEAGCITTDSEKLMKFCKTYRNYGSEKKYINSLKGVNSRLDELQAGYLNVKFKLLEKFTKQRRELAAYYFNNLSGIENLILPHQDEKSYSVFHLYVLQTAKRDELQTHLNKNGIGTSIHYPIPPHLQEAYSNLGYKKGDFPIAEKLANSLLSIPLYPGLKKSEQEFIIDSIRQFF
ncbi:MAG: aminotransferase [Candidatus Endolissoclinum sp. TMED37]|nr:MAG: aminotransferase [Candidatus Endolissoclinum sp. TMED37]|tara:strand:+ start:491 stop:1588 length:1098 start_codon:yes stop_codon:yes gene_type:complete